MAFGLAGLWVVARDLWQHVRPPVNPNAWFFGQMIGMVSSATAAMSAFSVTNLSFLPPVLRILWPACIAIPVLIVWVRHYRRTLAIGRELASFFTVRVPATAAVAGMISEGRAEPGAAAAGGA